MRLTTRATAIALALSLAPAAAFAQATSDKAFSDWSVIGSQINTGKPFQDVRAGWPSVDFGYTMSLGKSSDIGFRFGLLYGVEGTTYSQFGLGVWAPIRFDIGKTGKLNWLFHVDPGLKIYFGGSTCYYGYCATTSSTAFGFSAPVGVVAGYKIQPNLEIGGGADINLALSVTSPVNFIIGPMVGPYVEYHLSDPNLAIGLNTRFGVAIPTASGSSVSFAMVIQAFAGYRLF
jgi:hypothetical protein